MLNFRSGCWMKPLSCFARGFSSLRTKIATINVSIYLGQMSQCLLDQLGAAVVVGSQKKFDPHVTKLSATNL